MKNYSSMHLDLHNTSIITITLIAFIILGIIVSMIFFSVLPKTQKNYRIFNAFSILIILISSLFIFLQSKYHNKYRKENYTNSAPSPSISSGTRWMTDLFKDTPDVSLNYIVIPGTHDSLTGCLYNASCSFTYPPKNEKWLTKKTFDIIASRYVITQSLTPIQQILQGVRYLDLRLWWDGKDWYGVHGLKYFVTTLKITDFISDIYTNFIQNSNQQKTKEILILNFYKFLSVKSPSSPPDYEGLASYITNTLPSSSLIPVQSPIPTYQEVWPKKGQKGYYGNKILILFSPDGFPTSGSAPTPGPAPAPGPAPTSRYIWNYSKFKDCWFGQQVGGSSPPMDLSCCPTLPITTWDEIKSCYITLQTVPNQIYPNNFKNTQAHYQQPDFPKNKKDIKDIWDYIKQIDMTLVHRAKYEINGNLITYLQNKAKEKPEPGFLNIITMDGWNSNYLQTFITLNKNLFIKN
jgi:hypothetical protein